MSFIILILLKELTWPDRVDNKKLGTLNKNTTRANFGWSSMKTTKWKRESLISPLGRFLYWLWLHRPLLLHLHRGLGGSPGRPAGLGWLRHRLLQHWGLGRGFPRGPPGVLPGCPGGVEALRHRVLQHGAVSAGPGPGGSRGCGRLGHGLVCRVVLLNLLLASASPGLGLTRSLRNIFISKFYHQKRLDVRGDFSLVDKFGWI